MTPAAAVNANQDDKQNELEEKQVIFNMKPERANSVFTILILLFSLLNCILPIVNFQSTFMILLINGASISVTSTLLYVFDSSPAKRNIYMMMQLMSALLIVCGNTGRFYYFDIIEVLKIIFLTFYINIMGVGFFVFRSVDNQLRETERMGNDQEDVSRSLTNEFIVEKPMVGGKAVEARKIEEQKLMPGNKQQRIFMMKPKIADLVFTILIVVFCVLNCFPPTYSYLQHFGVFICITSSFLHLFGSYPRKGLIYATLQVLSALLILSARVSYFANDYGNFTERNIAFAFNICYGNVLAFALYTVISVPEDDKPECTAGHKRKLFNNLPNLPVSCIIENTEGISKKT